MKSKIPWIVFLRAVMSMLFGVSMVSLIAQGRSRQSQLGSAVHARGRPNQRRPGSVNTQYIARYWQAKERAVTSTRAWNWANRRGCADDIHRSHAERDCVDQSGGVLAARHDTRSTA